MDAAESDRRVSSLIAEMATSENVRLARVGLPYRQLGTGHAMASHTRMPSAALSSPSAQAGSIALLQFKDGGVQADVRQLYGADAAKGLDRCLEQLMKAVPEEVRSKVTALAFDGTSGTALLVDKASGRVLAAPRMYNEAQAPEAVQAAGLPLVQAAGLAPGGGVAGGAGGGARSLGLLHHADWLASLMHGQSPGVACCPPGCSPPGAPAGLLLPEAAERYGLPGQCWVAAGTTDSIAAFMAAGVSEPGQAVTSLGSSLTIKLLSNVRVDDASFGVYSHRLGPPCLPPLPLFVTSGDQWLVGGSSNTGGGGAALRHFTSSQLQELSRLMDDTRPTGLDYYPLVKPGERFPINDPQLTPRLQPRPQDDVMFLQGMFEAMARIEAQGYRLLQQLGVRPGVTEVLTAGGGAVNPSMDPAASPGSRCPGSERSARYEQLPPEKRRDGEHHLREYVDAEGRDLGAEAYGKFNRDVYKRVDAMLRAGNEASRRLGGVLAIDELIDVRVRGATAATHHCHAAVPAAASSSSTTTTTTTTTTGGSSSTSSSTRGSCCKDVITIILILIASIINSGIFNQQIMQQIIHKHQRWWWLHQ
ncbi:hypothetical protein QJQ45_021673 [Haematococcus lacustris]|nr:hypothetical protein QJQ45_021673 [Haematococcus lacustris]